jgi:alpha-L-fucosidase
MALYYSSVGRNSNLLLNVPPDRRGLLHENDVKSLMGFKELLDKEFPEDLAKSKAVSASAKRGKGFEATLVNDGNKETYWATKDDVTTGDIIIDLGQETEVNRIILQEYIKLGQRVQEFTVSAIENGEWKKLLDGTTIGYKVIRKFPVVKTSKIKVSISKSKACPTISDIELYRAPGE